MQKLIRNIIRTTGAALVLTLVSLGIIATGNSSATAAGRLSASVQPYGGCKEAHAYPQTRGAADCRALGWTVRPRLVVDPRGVVRFSRLPHCAIEDASSGPVPCSWNFGPGDGNGRGLSYWVDRHDRTHYVTMPRHAAGVR